MLKVALQTTQKIWFLPPAVTQCKNITQTDSINAYTWHYKHSHLNRRLRGLVDHESCSGHIFCIDMQSCVLNLRPARKPRLTSGLYIKLWGNRIHISTNVQYEWLQWEAMAKPLALVHHGTNQNGSLTSMGWIRQPYKKDMFAYFTECLDPSVPPSPGPFVT